MGRDPSPLAARTSFIGTLMYCRPETMEHIAGRFCILSHHIWASMTAMVRASAARG